MSRDALIRRATEVPGRSKSHDRSKKQERELATRMKARQVPASGAKSVKGDVRKKGVMRIEAKTTKHDSFRVTREMIDKIEDAALSCDEIPVIIVELAGESGKPRKEVAILPVYVLEDL